AARTASRASMRMRIRRAPFGRERDRGGGTGKVNATPAPCHGRARKSRVGSASLIRSGDRLPVAPLRRLDVARADAERDGEHLRLPVPPDLDLDHGPRAEGTDVVHDLLVLPGPKVADLHEVVAWLDARLGGRSTG